MSKHTGESENKNSTGHSHAKHMWMMVACCALPIIGFFAIAFLGISAPSLETAIALICPVGMAGMMYMMHRDSKSKENAHSCCKQDPTTDPVSAVERDKQGNEPVLVGADKPGILKA